MEEHLVSELNNLFTAEELPGGIHAMTSLGVGEKPPRPERPYIVWRELTTVEYDSVSETSNVEQRSFQIWVYDFKGDFTRINSYLRRIKHRVKTMAPFQEVDEEGIVHRCSGSTWGGTSATFGDDGYDSATRYGTARFTVSQEEAVQPL